MANEKKLLAVDLGASGGKCFVGVFGNGAFSMQEIHRFSHEGVSFFLPESSGQVTERTFWDDTLLYANIMTGLRAFRRDLGDVVESIGIDTWGADGNVVDANGEMLGKIYCYRDHRLDPMIDEVKSRMNPAEIYRITGIHFQPFNVSNQLRWFVTRRKNLLLPGCSFLPIPTVFYYYLGGVKKVDSSWASVTQLMDARKKCWSAEILKALEIPPAMLPEIVEPGTVLGTVSAPLAESVGLNRARLVAVGSHDTASAFAAAPIRDPAEALIISSGTWSLLGKLVPEPITTEAAMKAGISNEGGIGNVRFLKNCMGSWLVQELRRMWRNADGKEMDWPTMDRLTQAAPAFQAFIDPDDQGFYNPRNMETAINEYCRKTGQTPPQDRGGYLKLVYESLALKYRLVNEQICGVSGTKTKVVNIVGGGSRNKLLNQFTADALGVPVLAGPEEATAVGNLMVQAMGLGLLCSLKDAGPLIQQAFPIAEYKPRDSQTWNKAFERFQSVVSR